MFFAYVDPGTGALIWQSIVAAFVGFLFYVKKTRRWIVGVFRKMFGRGEVKIADNPGISAETPVAKIEAKIEAKTELP